MEIKFPLAVVSLLVGGSLAATVCDKVDTVASLVSKAQGTGDGMDLVADFAMADPVFPELSAWPFVACMSVAMLRPRNANHQPDGPTPGTMMRWREASSNAEAYDRRRGTVYSALKIANDITVVGFDKALAKAGQRTRRACGDRRNPLNGDGEDAPSGKV